MYLLCDTNNRVLKLLNILMVFSSLELLRLHESGLAFLTFTPKRTFKGYRIN